MTAPSRQQLALMLVWAFRDQKVETAKTPHPDALTLFHNVIALPVDEAAALISCARSGDISPTDPIILARWTRGLFMLRDSLQQPLCDLEITKLAQRETEASAA